MRRAEFLTPPPLAFVIGGTGESLSLTGLFFSAGRSYSIKVSAPTRSLFPAFQRPAFRSVSPHRPRRWGSGAGVPSSFPPPTPNLLLRKICFSLWSIFLVYFQGWGVCNRFPQPCLQIPSFYWLHTLPLRDVIVQLITSDCWIIRLPIFLYN